MKFETCNKTLDINLQSFFPIEGGRFDIIMVENVNILQKPGSLTKNMCLCFRRQHITSDNVYCY